MYDRQPLLRNRMKNEKELFIKFITSYYSPILENTKLRSNMVWNEETGFEEPIQLNKFLSKSEAHLNRLEKLA